MDLLLTIDLTVSCIVLYLQFLILYREPIDDINCSKYDCCVT